jgi:hypothetical protein
MQQIHLAGGSRELPGYSETKRENNGNRPVCTARESRSGQNAVTYPKVEESE